jgi:hypothetical protein
MEIASVAIGLTRSLRDRILPDDRENGDTNGMYRIVPA